LSNIVARAPASGGRDPRYLLVTCYLMGGLVGAVVLALLVLLAVDGHPLPLLAAAVGALLPFPLRGVAYLLGIPRPVRGRTLSAYPVARAKDEARIRQAHGDEMTRRDAPGPTRLGPSKSSSDRSLRNTPTAREVIIHTDLTHEVPSARAHADPHLEQLDINVALGEARFKLSVATRNPNRLTAAVVTTMLILSGCFAGVVLAFIGVPIWGSILGSVTPACIYVAVRLVRR
jgi:hypothetical protein